jgi:hypothetical protein
LDFEPIDFEPQDHDGPRSESPAGFDSLVENALDFLQQGLTEVKEHPKYSVIHFCAGIELLLKARLLHEHWALVLARPGETSKQKFALGEFDSANMHQCFVRLDNVCAEKMVEERECFLELAAHRNRVIHFFHEAYAGEPDGKLLEKIVIQQLKAGAFLMRLLRLRWRSQFAEYDEEINGLERSLTRQREYLAAKFEIIQPILEKFKKEGGEVWICFLCGMEAAEVLEDGLLKKTRCLVCERPRNHIQIKCPDCETCEVDFDVGQGECEQCEATYDMEFLMSEFDAEGVAYCPECSYLEHSVIEYGDGYLCLACANEFDKVGTCEWCGEDVAGDMSASYLMGCMFCDGLTGHHAND